MSQDYDMAVVTTSALVRTVTVILIRLCGETHTIYFMFWEMTHLLTPRRWKALCSPLNVFSVGHEMHHDTTPTSMDHFISGHVRSHTHGTQTTKLLMKEKTLAGHGNRGEGGTDLHETQGKGQLGRKHLFESKRVKKDTSADSPHIQKAHAMKKPPLFLGKKIQARQAVHEKAQKALGPKTKEFEHEGSNAVKHFILFGATLACSSSAR